MITHHINGTVELFLDSAVGSQNRTIHPAPGFHRGDREDNFPNLIRSQLANRTFDIVSRLVLQVIGNQITHHNIRGFDFSHIFQLEHEIKVLSHPHLFGGINGEFQLRC